MSYWGQCLICGLYVSSSEVHTNKHWLSVFQAFRLEEEELNTENQVNTPRRKGRLRAPSFDPGEIPQDGRYVHSSCWSIVVKVVGSTEFEETWLDQFFDCLESVGPLTYLQTSDIPDCEDADVYLPPSPYTCYPSYLESEDPDVSDAEEIQPAVFERFNVPDEIVQHIFSFLPNYLDVLNLEFAAGQSASNSVWLSLGQKFIAVHPSLNLVDIPQRTAMVRCAMQNIVAFEFEYPRATNYARIWDAVEGILVKLQNPQGQSVGPEDDLSVTRSYGIEPFSHTKELVIPEKFAGLKFHYKEFYEGTFLCGIQVDNMLLGYTGDEVYPLKIDSLRGLQLAMGVGIFSARARGSRGWSKWKPSLENEKGRRNYLLIEPIVEINQIRADFETFRIVGIRYATWSHPRLLPPFSCYPYLPLPGKMPPCTLIDRIPNKPECKNKVFLNDVTLVTTVSAFVCAEYQVIIGLEVFYKNNPVFLGPGPRAIKTDEGITKLSFHLDSERNEVLEGFGCAEASLNRGLSVKFITNHGRSVLFGDDTPELWNFGHLGGGIFCATDEPLSETHTNGPLSRAGVFFTSEVFNETSKYVQPTTWPIIDASCSHHKNLTAFISFASLRSVSWIIVYHRPESQILSGIQLIYNCGPPAMLGEMVDECVSLAIREPITSIRVYLKEKTCSFLDEITGVTFVTETYRTGAGDWEQDADKEDIVNYILDVPEDEIDPQLYWCFEDGGFGCLSFSTDDFVSDHPPEEIAN